MHIRNASLDVDDHQLTRLREEAGRAAKILDSLGKNAEADKLRYLFGVSTPKDNERSDTQGAENAP